MMDLWMMIKKKIFVFFCQGDVKCEGSRLKVLGRTLRLDLLYHKHACVCLFSLPSEQRSAQSVPGVSVSERPPAGAATFPWRGAARSVPAAHLRGLQTGSAAGAGPGQQRETLLWLAVRKQTFSCDDLKKNLNPNHASISIPETVYFCCYSQIMPHLLWFVMDFVQE